MPTIKTKTANASIKTLQAVTNGADKMKQSYIKTKEEAEEAATVQGETSQTYAARQLEQYEGKATSRVKDAVIEAPNAAKNAQQLYKKHLAMQRQKAAQAKIIAERGRTLAQKQSSTFSASKQLHPKGIGATAAQPKQKAMVDAIKTSQKAAGRTGKYIKNALYAKTAAKTTRRSLEMGRKLAMKTIRVTRITAKAAITAAKLAIKAAAVLIKSLVAWLVAGGAVAVAIILTLVMVALIVSSPAGIFFSGETPTTQSLSSVVDTLTSEFENEIEQIKASVEHDTTQLIGEPTPDWGEILPVFAVKAATNEGENMSVVMITNEQVNLLREIMWDMNGITHSTTEIPIGGAIPVPGGTDQGMTMTRVYLTIEFSHESANDTASVYGFSDFQLEQLAELQSPIYDLIWAGLAGIA